ncbi:hypothetical protein EJB05_50032, partial [Eragrostis curvula]
MRRTSLPPSSPDLLALAPTHCELPAPGVPPPCCPSSAASGTPEACSGAGYSATNGGPSVASSARPHHSCKPLLFPICGPFRRVPRGIGSGVRRSIGALPLLHLRPADGRHEGSDSIGMQVFFLHTTYAHWQLGILLEQPLNNELSKLHHKDIEGLGNPAMDHCKLKAEEHNPTLGYGMFLARVLMFYQGL